MKEKLEPDIEIAPLLPHDEGAPHINAAPVYGASPGKDFFYAVPVRGEGPLRFSIKGRLPAGHKDRQG